MALSVEESEYTSVFELIHHKAHHDETPDNTNSKTLVKFIGAEHQCHPQGINFTLIDYLELVD